MKRTDLKCHELALTIAIGMLSIGLSSKAADAPPAETPKTPRQEFRDQLKGLTPAERDAKLKEFREKYGRTNPERQVMEKRREELKNLSAEEREKKIREWRQESVTNAAPTRSMSAEEREAHRKAIRARLHEQLTKLREAKKNGTLKPEQQKRLERLEEMTKRFEQTATNPAPRTVPARPVQ